MKNKRLLLLIPFFALTACNNTKEIDGNKAKEIVDAIRKKETPDNLTFDLINKGQSGQGKNRFEVDLAYKYQLSTNGYYVMLKGTQSGQKHDVEMYVIKGTTHGEVKYIKYFDEAKNDYVKAVSTSKDNADYETAFNEFTADRIISIYQNYAKANIYDAVDDPWDTRKYYSSKEGELIIEFTTDLKPGTPYEYAETAVSGKVTHKFEDYLFTSVYSDTVSTSKNTWLTDGTVDYKTEVKLALPSDWESYIKLER